MSLTNNVMQPFKNIDSAAVSGVTTFTSSASNVLYLSDVCQQYSWSGNPSGIFYIQGSIDYNPGTPSSKGTANSGTWVSLSLDPVPTTSSGSFYMVNMTGLAFPWVRTFYVNSTGSGVLTGYISGKS